MVQTYHRDKLGRFTAEPVAKGYDRALAENLGLVKRRPFRAWLSHNRWAIVGYSAYVLLCLVAGAIGGYIGVSIGLK